MLVHSFCPSCERALLTANGANDQTKTKLTCHEGNQRESHTAERLKMHERIISSSASFKRKAHLHTPSHAYTKRGKFHSTAAKVPGVSIVAWDTSTVTYRTHGSMSLIAVRYVMIERESSSYLLQSYTPHTHTHTHTSAIRKEHSGVKVYVARRIALLQQNPFPFLSDNLHQSFFHTSMYVRVCKGVCFSRRFRRWVKFRTLYALHPCEVKAGARRRNRMERKRRMWRAVKLVPGR